MFSVVSWLDLSVTRLLRSVREAACELMHPCRPPRTRVHSGTPELRTLSQGDLSLSASTSPNVGFYLECERRHRHIQQSTSNILSIKIKPASAIRPVCLYFLMTGCVQNPSLSSHLAVHLMLSLDCCILFSAPSVSHNAL